METCWVFLPRDTTGMWRSSLMNALPLCGSVNCHCSYCFDLGMSLFWLTSCRNHICFRKIMSNISLIVIRWLRNSDFPGLQGGKWILCVALSNSWTNSCNPLRQPSISSVCAVEVLGLFGFCIWRKYMKEIMIICQKLQSMPLLLGFWWVSCSLISSVLHFRTKRFQFFWPLCVGFQSRWKCVHYKGLLQM